MRGETHRRESGDENDGTARIRRTDVVVRRVEPQVDEDRPDCEREVARVPEPTKVDEILHLRQRLLRQSGARDEHRQHVANSGGCR